MIGQTISHYRITAMLGRGGMGVVYRATDTRLQRDVALKFLPEGADEASLARFEREARSTSALNHPHICTIYDVGQDGGHHFIAMEVLEGSPLDRIISGDQVPFRQILEWAIQIADALETAHRAGIIHRDIKPSNVFITTRQDAKLLDFGLAKETLERRVASSETGITVSGTMTKERAVMGTVAYMSPEQAQGKPSDHRTDIFSFGVLLYELAAKRRPFRGDTTAELTADILRGTPAPLRNFNAEVPPEFQRIVSKALEKDPDDRYESAHELKTDLRRLRRELYTTSSSTEILPSPERRFPTKKLLLVTAALVAVAIIFFAFIAQPPPVPTVIKTTQLTATNAFRLGLLTDGSRLYFLERVNGVLTPMQMSVNGGNIIPVPQIVNPATDSMLDVSPDGADMIILRDGKGDPPRGPVFRLPLLGGPAQRLSNVIAQDARFSRDGKQIVLVDAATVEVMGADGTDVRKVYENPGHIAFFPSFSPDGKRIRFVTQSGPEPLDLMEVDLSSLKSRRISTVASFDGGGFLADGRYVYQSDRESFADLYTLVEPKWYQFGKQHEVKLTQSQVHMQGMVPALTGDKVFIVGRTRQGSMMAWNPKTHAWAPFLNGLSALNMQVSPDGQWILYREYPTRALWRCRIDGSDRQLLVKNDVLAPRWSPDGRRIVYQNIEARAFVLNADGTGLTPLPLAQKGLVALLASWSADNKTIAFNGLPKPDDLPKGIFLYDTETQAVSIMPDTHGYIYASFSPDGKWMVALVADPRRFVLYSAATKQWRELTDLPDLSEYWWSSDNRSILFEREGSGNSPSTIYSVAIADGKVTRIADTSGLTPQGLASTIDGQPVVLNDTSITHIYALEVK